MPSLVLLFPAWTKSPFLPPQEATSSGAWWAHTGRNPGGAEGALTQSSGLGETFKNIYQAAPRSPLSHVPRFQILLSHGLRLEKDGCPKAWPHLGHQERNASPGTSQQICPQKCQQPTDTNAAPTTWGHIPTAPHSSHSSMEISLMKGLSLAAPLLPAAPRQNKPFSTPISDFGKKI